MAAPAANWPPWREVAPTAACSCGSHKSTCMLFRASMYVYNRSAVSALSDTANYTADSRTVWHQSFELQQFYEL